jgi:transcriptional regulator with XRE-family HTH domain
MLMFVNIARLHFNGIVDRISQYRRKVEERMNVELYLKEMGQRIMERRKKLGLTQEALAERSELTTQFVSYAESGKRGMRPENLMKIAAALGVSTDYLLTGDIIDKDKLLLSDKLGKLSPQQVRIVESVVDECIHLFSKRE